MIKKVIIPAAGLGTRLLSSTKETPKEMLPIFAKDSKNEICIKPMLQVIFEQLYHFGFRDYCIVIGRGKRAIEDHFSPDRTFLKKLTSKNKNNLQYSLEEFYNMMDNSNIVWINQPTPLGFGDAVLRSKSFVHNEPFLVHAGDTAIISKNNQHLTRLIKNFHDERNSILLQKVKDGTQYGIAEIDSVQNKQNIVRVVEKPKKPKSPWAIMPLYVFTPTIFDALKNAIPDKKGELQLTTGIQNLINKKESVMGVPMIKNELKLDIGTPEMYWDSLRVSHKYSQNSSIKNNEVLMK
jgi:UTP--glucose-1-phosphate uridylyltransferase